MSEDTVEIEGFELRPIKNGAWVEITGPDWDCCVEVPFYVLAQFVAGWVVGEKIKELENAATFDVLLGKAGK